MTIASPSEPPDGLDDVFDPVAAKALRAYARARDETVRLPGTPWQSEGYSGAKLVVIYFESAVATCKRIVKVLPNHDHANETRAHNRAIALSPEFAKQHLVEQLGDRHPVGDGRYLMFQEPAGSLLESRTLGALPEIYWAEACDRVVSLLLAEWNSPSHLGRGLAYETYVQYLQHELRKAFREPGDADPWLAVSSAPSEDDGWITLPGDRRIPNPLWVVRPGYPVHRRIDYLRGHTHGDLHMGNVFVPYKVVPRFDGIRFVDLSAYDHRAPLSRDVVTLMLSVVSAELRTDEREVVAEALLNLVVDPDGREVDSRQLRPIITEPVRALYRPCLTLFEEYQDEWRTQYLLSVVAQALVHSTYENLGEYARGWFLRLVKRAAMEFCDLLPADHARFGRPTAPASVSTPPVSPTSVSQLSGPQHLAEVRPSVLPPPAPAVSHPVPPPLPPPLASPSVEVSKAGAAGQSPAQRAVRREPPREDVSHPAGDSAGAIAVTRVPSPYDRLPGQSAALHDADARLDPAEPFETPPKVELPLAPNIDEFEELPRRSYGRMVMGFVGAVAAILVGSWVGLHSPGSPAKANRPSTSAGSPSPAAGTASPSLPGTTIDLAEPEDHETSVSLRWSGPPNVAYTVQVSSQHSVYVGSWNFTDIHVRRRDLYCFRVTGQDGARAYSSQMRSIRGGVCQLSSGQPSVSPGSAKSSPAVPPATAPAGG